MSQCAVCGVAYVSGACAGYHRIIARSILRPKTTVSIIKGTHKFLFESFNQEANPKDIPGVMNQTESSIFPLSLKTIFSGPPLLQ